LIESYGNLKGPTSTWAIALKKKPKIKREIQPI